jgi:hypothetical protein
MRTWRVLVGAAVIIAIAAGGLAVAGHYGTGPLATRLGVSVTEATPQAAARLGEGGDPLVIAILFPWPGDGYCSGQFSVSATETEEEVRVSDVISREYRGGSCAGLGTVGGMAGADLTLAAPLGQRKVVRASDGVTLTVITR